MTLLKQILKNEIKDALGHEPSDKEFTSALKYISENITEKDQLLDVEILVNDWCGENCVKCLACDEYFLTEDCIEVEGKWFCNESCINDYCWENGLLFDYEADCFIEK